MRRDRVGRHELQELLVALQRDGVVADLFGGGRVAEPALGVADVLVRDVGYWSSASGLAPAPADASFDDWVSSVLICTEIAFDCELLNGSWTRGERRRARRADAANGELAGSCCCRL